MNGVLGTLRAAGQWRQVCSPAPSIDGLFELERGSTVDELEECLVYRGISRFSTVNRLISILRRQCEPRDSTEQLCLYHDGTLVNDTILDTLIETAMKASAASIATKRSEACKDLKALLNSVRTFSKADGALGVWTMAMHSANHDAICKEDGLLEALVPLLSCALAECRAFAAAAVWALCVQRRTASLKRMVCLNAHESLLSGLHLIVSQSETLTQLRKQLHEQDTPRSSTPAANQMFLCSAGGALACIAVDEGSHAALSMRLPVLVACARAAGGLMPDGSRGALAEQHFIQTLCHVLSKDGLGKWMTNPPCLSVDRDGSGELRSPASPVGDIAAEGMACSSRKALSALNTILRMRDREFRMGCDARGLSCLPPLAQNSPQGVEVELRLCIAAIVSSLANDAIVAKHLGLASPAFRLFTDKRFFESLVEMLRWGISRLGIRRHPLAPLSSEQEKDAVHANHRDVEPVCPLHTAANFGPALTRATATQLGLEHVSGCLWVCAHFSLQDGTASLATLDAVQQLLRGAWAARMLGQEAWELCSIATLHCMCYDVTLASRILNHVERNDDLELFRAIVLDIISATSVRVQQRAAATLVALMQCPAAFSILWPSTEVACAALVDVALRYAQHIGASGMSWEENPLKDKGDQGYRVPWPPVQMRQQRVLHSLFHATMSAALASDLTDNGFSATPPFQQHEGGKDSIQERWGPKSQSCLQMLRIAADGLNTFQMVVAEVAAPHELWSQCDPHVGQVECAALVVWAMAKNTTLRHELGACGVASPLVQSLKNLSNLILSSSLEVTIEEKLIRCLHACLGATLALCFDAQCVAIWLGSSEDNGRLVGVISRILEFFSIANASYDSISLLCLQIIRAIGENSLRSERRSVEGNDSSHPCHPLLVANCETGGSALSLLYLLAGEPSGAVSSNVRAGALVVLETLASSDLLGKGDSDRARELSKHCDEVNAVGKLIEDMLRDDSDDANIIHSEAASSLLRRNLGHADVESVWILKCSDIIRLLLTHAIQPGSLDTRIKSLMALLVLSTEDPVKVELGKIGIYSLLQIRWADEHQQISRFAAAILTSLAEHPSNRTLFYKAELRVKAMAGWKHTPEFSTAHSTPRKRKLRGERKDAKLSESREEEHRESFLHWLSAITAKDASGDDIKGKNFSRGLGHSASSDLLITTKQNYEVKGSKASVGVPSIGRHTTRRVASEPVLRQPHSKVQNQCSEAAIDVARFKSARASVDSPLWDLRSSLPVPASESLVEYKPQWNEANGRVVYICDSRVESNSGPKAKSWRRSILDDQFCAHSPFTAREHLRASVGLQRRLKTRLNTLWRSTEVDSVSTYEGPKSADNESIESPKTAQKSTKHRSRNIPATRAKHVHTPLPASYETPARSSKEKPSSVFVKTRVSPSVQLRDDEQRVGAIDIHESQRWRPEVTSIESHRKKSLPIQDAEMAKYSQNRVSRDRSVLSIIERRRSEKAISAQQPADLLFPGEGSMQELQPPPFTSARGSPTESSRLRLARGRLNSLIRYQVNPVHKDATKATLPPTTVRVKTGALGDARFVVGGLLAPSISVPGKPAKPRLARWESVKGSRLYGVSGAPPSYVVKSESEGISPRNVRLYLSGGVYSDANAAAALLECARFRKESVRRIAPPIRLEDILITMPPPHAPPALPNRFLEATHESSCPDNDGGGEVNRASQYSGLESLLIRRKLGVAEHTRNGDIPILHRFLPPPPSPPRPEVYLSVSTEKPNAWTNRLLPSIRGGTNGWHVGDFRNTPLKFKLMRSVAGEGSNLVRTAKSLESGNSWSVETSVFKERSSVTDSKAYTRNSELLDRMFEHDWMCCIRRSAFVEMLLREGGMGLSCTPPDTDGPHEFTPLQETHVYSERGGIKPLLKNAAKLHRGRLQRLKEAARQVFPTVIEHYNFYSAISQDHDPFSLQYTQFFQWLDDCGLVDDASRFSRRVDFDILFTSITRPNHALLFARRDHYGSITAAFRGGGTTESAFHLDRALLRFEMLQAVITTAIRKKLAPLMDWHRPRRPKGPTNSQKERTAECVDLAMVQPLKGSGEQNESKGSDEIEPASILACENSCGEALLQVVLKHLDTAHLNGNPHAKVAIHDSNSFRRDRLYTEECDTLLREHFHMLHSIFHSYSFEHAHEEWMSMAGWLRLLRTVHFLDDDFTVREAKLCFVWSKIGVVRDVADRENLISANFFDFLEALARAAELKSIPSSEELLKVGYRSIREYVRALESGAHVTHQAFPHSTAVRRPSTLRPALTRRPSAEFFAPKTRPLHVKLGAVLTLLHEIARDAGYV